MLTDYKFWFINRDDSGFITACAVRFYEGQIIGGKYHRARRLELADLNHLKRDIAGKTGLYFITESNGSNTVGYTTSDFGKIKDDNELRLFLNMELAKDTNRTPITEQTLAL